MPKPPPVPARGRRPRVEAEKSLPRPPMATVPAGGGMVRTYWVRVWEYLNGGGGLCLTISFGLHAILLALLAIPVFRIMQQEQSAITSIVQGSDGGDGQGIGDPGGMELSLSQLHVPSSDPLKELLIDGPAMVPTMLPSIDPSDLPTAPQANSKGGRGGKGNGRGTGIGDGMGGEGGIRIIEPPNAIRAGNFSVWCWPIVSDVKGKVIHADPGSSPAVLQPYHIVIRLKVPEGKRTVNLSDFSGQVVGSDKYTQKIPQDAWFYNAGGDLVRARTGRSIPVFEGTAELLIRVPGAGSSLVKDSITVSSRLTDEEQKVELQFQDRNALR